MRKLLFFDIDGTILTEDEGTPDPSTETKERYIPQSAIRAIHELQAAGHLCFINSGRSWSEIHSTITDLNFDGYVCGCGTFITYHKEVLLSHEIPLSLANEIYQDLHAYRLEWILEGQHATFYSTLPYQTRIGTFFKEYKALFPENSFVCPPEARDLHFDKFCICTTPKSDIFSFRQKYEQQFSFIDRGDGFYEIVPVGHSKATGIQFLMDYFDIPLEDTIAVGDSTNDLPMLEFAGISIAMKKSDALVLDTVDYVTDTVENDGIYKAMKHFQFI